MIIDDFHIRGTFWRSAKTNAKLIVDANAVLSLAIALESLKMIAGRRS
jgi:hypothetical protein